MDFKGTHMLGKNYNIKAVFADFALRMPAGSELKLTEYVTGVEDAWLNTLIFTVSHEHTRFCRPEEIIAAAAEYFTLTGYVADRQNISYHLNEPAGEQIESLPVNIRSAINPQITGNELIVDVAKGTFTFQRL